MLHILKTHRVSNGFCFQNLRFFDIEDHETPKLIKANCQTRKNARAFDKNKGQDHKNKKNMEGLLAKSQAKTWKNQQFARPFGKEKNQDLNNKNAGACWKTEAKHKQIQNNFDIFMLFSGKNKNNARKNKNIKYIKTYEKTTTTKTNFQPSRTH